MAGRDPASAGGRLDEPPAGTPPTPAIVIVLVAAIRAGAPARRRKAISAAPEPSFARAPGAVVVCGIACMPTRRTRTLRANEQAIAPCSKQELPAAGHSGTIMAKRLRTRDRPSLSERLTRAPITRQ